MYTYTPERKETWWYYEWYECKRREAERSQDKRCLFFSCTKKAKNRSESESGSVFSVDRLRFDF
jgi:hypothetical protein